ncbi:MAG: hypothetical protein C4329_14675 [Chitinophagaceae bacterium]
MKNIITIIFSSLVFFSCSNAPKEIVFVEKAVTIDSTVGECPYLTKDTKGNTVLSWVRIINDSTTAFCYAVSVDGKTFSKPVVIPNTSNIQPHGENMPKIIFKPSGEVIALWGAANPNPKNKYSGLVYYTNSTDGGKTWSDVKPLVTDTSSYDQRYYDVAILANGEAGIIWLDNRKTINKQGSGLYFASTNGSNGFDNPKLVSQPCCQCCRTKLYVDEKGAIHALYRGILQDSIRDMVHIVSKNGGKTFSNPQRISEDNWVLSACPHTGPAMTGNKEGMHFTWYTGGAKAGCYYTKSTDNGKTYIMHDSVSEKGTHPQIATVGKSVLIVWDENDVVNNKVYRKIGLQKRSASGKAEGKTYITKESNTSFPVIAATKNNSSILAYTKQEGKKSYVQYQVISLR